MTQTVFQIQNQTGISDRMAQCRLHESEYYINFIKRHGNTKLVNAIILDVRYNIISYENLFSRTSTRV